MLPGKQILFPQQCFPTWANRETLVGMSPQQCFLQQCQRWRPLFNSHSLGVYSSYCSFDWNREGDIPRFFNEKTKLNFILSTEAFNGDSTGILNFSSTVSAALCVSAISHIHYYINRNYFMVGECVRFLFTSCEGSFNKRTSERSERVSLAILHNE